MFTEMTTTLLERRRMSGFYLQFPAALPDHIEVLSIREAFEGKTALKGNGIQYEWHNWLVESLFPTFLYRENKGDLRKLIADPRIWEIAGFSGNWNNSFGRMARPRQNFPQGFVHFLLERWSGKYRGMPQYYFDVEEPEWVLTPLASRPDIPKTGRTSVSCVMNYGFHWLDGAAHISIILRHLNWSHGWGDVFGGEEVLRAICKELNLPIGNVTIFANSATMDEPRIAKRYLKVLQEYEEGEG